MWEQPVQHADETGWDEADQRACCGRHEGPRRRVFGGPQSRDIHWNDAVETQDSHAQQVKVAKERGETVWWPASRNGGPNQNPTNPFPPSHSSASSRDNRLFLPHRSGLKLEGALFTFIREAGVEPTNNVAEHALRPAVQRRNVLV